MDLHLYPQAIAILLIVFSPLVIPVAVTLWHAVANWRGYEQLFGRSRPGAGALSPAV
jgi:hypothetical protein